MIALSSRFELPLAARRIARQAVAGESRTIQIGRSRNTSTAGHATPVVVIAGDSQPRLAGLPYLSTTFRRGSFTKNLYTPSTLCVEVGAEWLAANCPEYAAQLAIGAGI